ncbi:MAG: hypothetical protein KGY54_14445 [Oleiphilaceae bacterium]|nr:hypothetical protein [Oleiphilaceae bacterium]
MLSAKTIATVKATVPALQQHGEQITTHFYETLFSDYPEVKAYFNQAHQVQGTQPKALANSVLAYASHIDRLEALADALPMIIQKHVALDIRPEHYPLVGECLLRAIKDVLGDAATDDVMSAWAEAYQHLADLLISAEEALYQKHEAQHGGWRGPRNFRVVKKRARKRGYHLILFGAGGPWPDHGFLPGAIYYSTDGSGRPAVAPNLFIIVPAWCRSLSDQR